MNYLKNSEIVPILISFFIPLFLIWFIFRPAISLQSTGFWIMILISMIIATFVSQFLYSFEIILWGTIGIVILFVILLIGSSGMFHATSLQRRLNVQETTEFTKIVEDMDINSIPRIDKSVAQNLASRKLGELEDVVSQFEVDDYSTLINYNNSPYRVIPLKYSSPFKYFNNKNTGIPGYILVDLITQEASYIKLDEGIKYSPSACFKNDLKKHIRTVYSSAILGEYNFEINDDGIPYWIVPEIKPNFVFGVKTIENVIVVNAITGDISNYPILDVPEWIDRGLDTDIILSQIDSWGSYKDGFFNSIFGQKGVKKVTELYNFIIQDNDVYLYTGITSANASDQSNIGFFLVNMRTGDATYTSCASVNEVSAKNAAEAIFPEKAYEATDPLLLNIDGKPTYCTSLKDSAGLVKMYAFVYAADYTVIGYATEQEGMEKAIENYKLALEGKSFKVSSSSQNEVITEETSISKETFKEASFKVEAFEEVIVDGTTSYYIEHDGNIYIIPITANPKYFMNLSLGDEIKVKSIEKNNYFLVNDFAITSVSISNMN